MTEFRSLDPSTGRFVTQRESASPSEIDRALSASANAFRDWSAAPLADRADALRRLGAVLRRRAAADGLLMAEEMGKPSTQGKGEAEKCAWASEFAADHAESWLANEPVATEAAVSYVRRDPMGPILAIMPWNFPFWQLFRFGASALMAGNTIVLKHAPNVPRCAEAILEIAAEAGLPEGVIVAVHAGVGDIAGMIEDHRVAAVTLTGSTRAGQAVAAVAGRALKPSVLELGGSDPFLVLPDADLDRAATIGAKARLQNNGQSCIAAKRFIVVESVAEAFIERFQAALASHVVGDPRDAATQVGPMARADLRDELARQVSASIASGARCLLGGQVPAREGFWYPPTLLVDAAPGMAAWDDETFGPCAAVRVVPDVEAAIGAANASIYGLGATVFTEDRTLGERVAARLRGGAVFVNDLVRSDPRMPFGGTGMSGWGRELGREGMWQFMHSRSIWVA